MISCRLRMSVFAFIISRWSCVVAAADLNGTLILDVCENYADKGVVGSFLRICKEFGMDIKETQVTVFEQANVRL